MKTTMKCPHDECKGTLYLCTAPHADGYGDRYHCSASAFHTFMPNNLGMTNTEEN